MGKTLGFLEYGRELPADREPKERINDFQEIHGLLSKDKQLEQAARCMNCAVPFCHSGMTLGGAPSGCPLGNLIPEWNDLIYHGQMEKAARRLLITNSFPEFTGRVCPALCEGACTCGVHGDRITVRQNELTVIETAFENGWIKPEPPASRQGGSVGVIGSGPAGLSCANVLNRLGHEVTVYERADRVGGLLMYGIPNMKLDKAIIARRVELMEKEGVRFVTSCHVGVSTPVSELMKRHEALVLCCGSGKPRELTVPGRQGKGVIFAVDYLTASTKHVLDPKQPLPKAMDAKNKHVVIVGGGDTGTDCLGTAIRQGCQSAVQLEIMPMPPKERTAANPWPEYPRVLKTDYAQQEAICRFGTDPRLYQVQTLRIERDAQQGITAVVIQDVVWQKGDNGRMSPVPVPDSERSLPCDLLLIAMGFVGPEDTLINALDLERDARSNVLAENYQTARRPVFTAGDMHSGQSLVVRAINEGQRAAKACHSYLMSEIQ